MAVQVTPEAAIEYKLSLVRAFRIIASIDATGKL